MADWSPYASYYNALKCGSIDGTDTVPHDRAIIRAMNTTYRPNKNIVSDPKCTLFVSRLTPDTTDSELNEAFGKFGEIKGVRIVRDLVTGTSKCYGFVEYYNEKDVPRARRDGNNMVIDNKEVFVEYELERTLSGWIPRRFGGGFGGCKEAGQLRFGGRDRPFRKPLVKNHLGGDKNMSKNGLPYGRDGGRVFDNRNRDGKVSRERNNRYNKDDWEYRQSSKDHKGRY